ncbi:MAG: response regulator [Alphaproteobacteria bacterium]|nr:response regulator [Alphaproteobacteria bacterium]MBV9692482.1 response regulator [Alphaproteobacteria bacterium]
MSSIFTATGESDGHKATILIVDDETLVRWVIAEHLQACGFNVLGASSADEAIEAIRRFEGHIDIVFSDVRMPGTMDGCALAGWVRANRPSTAVILTSGDAQAQDMARELCEHVGDIVRKPYDFDAVVARIEHTLSAARSASQPRA